MNSKVIKVYGITYYNGVYQVKNLISHDDYVNVYKSTMDEIYDLEKINKFKETNTTKQLKRDLKDMFGTEWFTDKSPLYDAISSGKLKLPYGEYGCKFNII